MISKDNINFSCFNSSVLSGIKPETIKISISNPISSQFFNIDIEAHFNKILIDEISQTIEKKIFKSILKNGKKHFLDFRENQLSPFKFDKLLNLFPTGNKLISGARIGVDLQDSLYFSTLPISPNQRGAKSYLIGKFGHVDVYINPFDTWKSNHLLLFDSINVDVSNLQYLDDYHKPGSVTGYTSIVCDLRFEVLYPEVIFIFEDGYMEGYSEYIAEQRDSKIDYIVNEDGCFQAGQNNQSGIYIESELGSRYYHRV